MGVVEQRPLDAALQIAAVAGKGRLEGGKGLRKDHRLPGPAAVNPAEEGAAQQGQRPGAAGAPNLAV